MAQQVLQSIAEVSHVAQAGLEHADCVHRFVEAGLRRQYLHGSERPDVRANAGGAREPMVAITPSGFLHDEREAARLELVGTACEIAVLTDLIAKDVEAVKAAAVTMCHTGPHQSCSGALFLKRLRTS
jgi:hypothetical protein